MKQVKGFFLLLTITALLTYGSMISQTIKYMVLLIIAVGLAQSFVASVAIYFWQRKNPDINYKQASGIYFHSNVGRYVVVAISLLILCFVLSDWMDLSLSHAELLAKGKDALTKAEKIQLQFKSWAIGVGAFIEVIAIALYKTGLDKILNYGNGKGIADTDKTPNANG